MLRSAPYVAAGVLSHLCIFIRGEWHLSAPMLLRLFIVLSVLSTLVRVRLRLDEFPTAVMSFLRNAALYIVSLFASVCIYRLRFHRLSAFPGPPLARVSKFWHVWKCRTSQNHLILDELFQHYGDVVRTGMRHNRLGREATRANFAFLSKVQMS